MSVVLCLPACLCVRRSVPWPGHPTGTLQWRSKVTYATTPQPLIHGEPIVHGVSTGVPESKFFFEPHAPKIAQVFEGALFSKRALFFCRLCSNSKVVLKT